MRKPFLLAGLLLSMVGASHAQRPGDGPPPATVQVADVRIEPLAPTITLPGTVVSRDDSRVSAAVSGILLSVAEVGTRVAEGAPLAQIDPLNFRLSRRENAAQVAREKRRIEFLEAEVDRLESLGRNNLAARSQIEQTQRDLAVAREDLGIAQARLARIDADLERATVVAPFAGTVTERIANPGENVAIGAAVVRLVGLDRLEVSAMAPIRSVRFIDAGSTLDIRGAFGALTAEVRTKVPNASRGAHMFELRVPIPPGTFAVNEDVRLAVPTDNAEIATIVPRDALVLRRGKTIVYRITPDGVAEAVEVQPGAGRGSDITVSGELVAGDRVVTRGAERLSDGARVQTTVVERREISGG